MVTTPLQQAAQAVIDRCYEYNPHELPALHLELRKALDAELQQSVEPVATIVQRFYEDGSFAGNALEWSGKNEQNELPLGASLYLHPPQQAKQVPMTDDAIEDIWLIAREANDFPEVFARAIEAHHGIWQVDKDCLTTGGQP